MPKYLEEQIEVLKNDLITAFKDGRLTDYVYEEALEIIRDDDNLVEYILFTYGGPTIYLNVNEIDYNGYIVGTYGFKQLEIQIPLNEWENMNNEYSISILEELSNL